MKSRILTLNKHGVASEGPVVYVMSRDQRSIDNHALLYAQELALEHNLPLAVLFCLYPKSGHRSQEHFEFMIKGLEDVERDLSQKNIPLIITSGAPYQALSDMLHELNPAAIIFDFSPLRGPRSLQKKIADNTPAKVAVVDTHNIIPVWVASDKEEYAAHTFRSKVHKQLEDWIEKPGTLVKHEHQLKNLSASLSLRELRKKIEPIETSGVNVDCTPGQHAALQHLQTFIESGLEQYAKDRNIPIKNGVSGLSPYLHFGHLSPLRVLLNLLDETSEPPLLFRRAKLASYEGEATKMDSINAFIEELVVRKELADNYCFYNKNYDNLDGARDWAKKTLDDHRGDTRDHIYSQDQWGQAHTHDKAWNAAQKQMMQTGKMHGYMRMYWAKKILEWSKSPEEALEIAMYLNDKCSIDGGDPNGYVGIMWSIAGLHDRPWFERSVYGKIRYMNEGGLKRRFDVDEYLQMFT